MKIVRDFATLQSVLAQMPKERGFVPTMGYLHAGHVSLLERARTENEVVILSIFVNPLQFNQQEDFVAYPSDEERDLALAKESGVDLLWVPDVSQMYGVGEDWQLRAHDFDTELEGSSRPGHFTGVATVIMKLCHQLEPAKMYFGEKDFQQYQLIESMVSAFFMPIEVVMCATVREASGLAMSSRNARLTMAQRQQAALIYRAMRQYKSVAMVREVLENEGFRVDYVRDVAGRRFVAAWLSDVRVIDTVILAEQQKESISC